MIPVSPSCQGNKRCKISVAMISLVQHCKTFYLSPVTEHQRFLKAWKCEGMCVCECACACGSVSVRVEVGVREWVQM